MKIKFLGTGSVCGVPEWNCNCSVCKSKDPKDKRLRPALFVQIGNKNIAIDFGPDFRTQLLKYKIKRLDYVFLTHAHGDHMNGFMELARQKNLIFETPKSVLDIFKHRLGSTMKWFKARNPTMKIRTFKKKKIKDIEIDTIALKHQKDYIKKQFPCYGYLFKTKKFRFAYLSDFNEILEPEKVKNLDIIIVDGAGFDYSRRGHLGVKRSIDLYKKIKPKKMILTHINDTKSHKFLSRYVKKFGNIVVGYDGMQLELK